MFNNAIFFRSIVWRKSSGIVQKFQKRHCAHTDYRKDVKALARWLDLEAAINNEGRVVNPDQKLLNTSECLTFPRVPGTSLTEKSVVVPDDLGTTSSAKLVLFSFKTYGSELIRPWVVTFREKFGSNKSVEVIEICFADSMYSFFKRSIMNGLRQTIPQEHHENTVAVFGGINDFKADLLLPNKYTGYVYLLDKQNKIRWRACGAPESDVEIGWLLDATQQLVYGKSNNAASTDGFKSQPNSHSNKGKKGSKR